jgi:hypothetical protein
MAVAARRLIVKRPFFAVRRSFIRATCEQVAGMRKDRSFADPKRSQLIDGRRPTPCAFVCDDSEADVSERILSSRRDRGNPGPMTLQAST